MDKRKNCGIKGGKFTCKNTEAKTKLSYAKSKMPRCLNQTVPLKQCFHRHHLRGFLALNEQVYSIEHIYANR